MTVDRFLRHREANKRRYKAHCPDLEWADMIYNRDISFPDAGVYLLYFNEYGASGLGLLRSAYKIGLSDRIRKRWMTLQTGTPIELKPIHVIETNDLDWCESWLHNAMRSRRIYSDHEWFALSIDDIKSLLEISLLNKPVTARDQRRMLDLYEVFNPTGTRQESMF